MHIPYFIDFKALLKTYNKEICPILKHNGSFDRHIFVFEKDIIILSDSTYDDTYNEQADCICMELIELDDNNNYKYYYYNSINHMVDLFDGQCSDELEILEYYDEDEFYTRKIKLKDNEIVSIIKKCIDYYHDVQKITIYDQYNDPIYKNFIKKDIVREIVYKNIVSDMTLSNTKKTIKVFEILLPFINLLTDNNILFDFERFYIMKYNEPIIIFSKNKEFILVKIIDFENCEDKIIDLRINNNPLEHIIAYHNNKKAIISNTMLNGLLIDEMLKCDTYLKKFLSQPVFNE